MNAVLDMLLALVIVGMVLLLSMQLDANVKAHTITVREMNAANSNLVVISNIIEYDLRKAGHQLIAPQRAVTLADSNRIIFAYDQNPGAVFDSVRIEYSTRSNSTSPNPGDLTVVRKVNSNQTTEMNLGVTRLCFSYYNQAGTVLARPVPADSLPRIKVIQLDLVVQNKEAFRGEYQTAKYHSKITPKNMLIRYGR